jgi:broad specificity phosphatase PhoE
VSEGGFVLVRHGATEWSQNGRHTSTTDLPLLESGREQAQALAPLLAGEEFDHVLCSPRQRALDTCKLAGLGDRAEIVDDLQEWNYGDYEGLTSPQIREQRPDWSLWRDGCPGGELPGEVAARVDRVIARVGEGRIICFAHGHLLRVFTARWVGQGPEFGERLLLEPATVSVLGHEHETRAIAHWNARTL